LAQIIEKPIGPEARPISKTGLGFVKLKQVKRNSWLEVIVNVKWLSLEKMKWEYKECGELLAIFTSIGK